MFLIGLLMIAFAATASVVGQDPGCPTFGTEDRMQNRECEVQYNQVWADARARPKDVVVVGLSEDVCEQCEAECGGCAKWSPELEQCTILIAADFSSDDLTELQESCP